MSKKQDKGLLVILLPLGEGSPLHISHPPEVEDRLQWPLFAGLVQRAPLLQPVTLFQQPLLVHTHTYLHGSTVICFQPGVKGLPVEGSLHPLLLIGDKIIHHHAFLGGGTGLVPLPLPTLLAGRAHHPLFVYNNRPHILTINKEGTILGITEGEYGNLPDLVQKLKREGATNIETYLELHRTTTATP